MPQTRFTVRWTRFAVSQTEVHGYQFFESVSDPYLQRTIRIRTFLQIDVRIRTFLQIDVRIQSVFVTIVFHVFKITGMIEAN